MTEGSRDVAAGPGAEARARGHGPPEGTRATHARVRVTPQGGEPPRTDTYTPIRRGRRRAKAGPCGDWRQRAEARADAGRPPGGEAAGRTRTPAHPRTQGRR